MAPDRALAGVTHARRTLFVLRRARIVVRRLEGTQTYASTTVLSPPAPSGTTAAAGARTHDGRKKSATKGKVRYEGT